MDHIGILRRALERTWRHKSMWLFGFLMVLTGAGGGGGGGNPAQWATGRPGPWAGPRGLSFPPGALVLAAVGAVLILLLAAAAVVLRYVTETGLVALTGAADRGEEVTVRRGFRQGWSRSAWRLFLIDLLVWVPFVLAAAVLVGVALTPLLLLLADAPALKALGVAGAVGAFLAVLAVLVAAGVVLGLLRQFFLRQCVLEGLGVLASVREGAAFVRRHLRDVAIMWLLMVGVGIAWGFLSLLLMAILGGATAVVGGIPAYLLTQTTGGWVAGALVLVPVGIVLIVLPMAFASALYVTFQYNVWTLTYLELAREEGVPA